MKLSPLEDHSALFQVPGTIVLSDATETDRLDLKRNPKGDIILSPQPSEDPNDPLNWPTYKKLTVVIILMFGSCVCASTIGPLLSASLFVLSEDLHRPLSDITLTTGYTLLASGCAGPLVSSIARKLGKRPAFIFCSFMGLLGSIIGAVSASYNGLLAARVVQGFATCAYESLVISVVGDIFFVHQRGLYSSFMIFTLNCVSNMSPIVCGPITNNLGWRWLFILLAIIIGVQLALCFLFVPETTYRRDPRYNTDETANTNLEELTKIEHQHNEVLDEPIADRDKSVREVTGIPIPKKKTWLQELKVYNGIMSDESILAMFAAPFLSCTNLAVFWMVIVSGGVTSFYVAASYVVAQIFSPPPYLLNASQVGYTFLGPFIGGILGTLAVGAISDSIALWLTKRNKGIYEPEFRLVPILLGLAAGAGFIGFGYVTSMSGSVYTASFLWGLSIFGVTFVVVPSSAYIIDAFRDLSHEAFIAAMMFKNFIFYGYSTFMNDWTASAGPHAAFYTFGGATFALVLTTVIVYIWGKRYRSFWHRHNMFEKLHIRSQVEM
ncbi:serine/threonine kinase 16 [Mytilinidion resinicola]|uniref:Serine/threonine kinase 16 n=1 Tax=Mytilinidion resinicola TaxID=574789 RepID=A0A6A6Z5P3_9PEZI|nr:serine/threonine kinase 16 [Mytilinidion resinicola]KAF2815577.1 serine/threonine kinase 16 [Mytilinidion resinicola]